MVLFLYQKYAHFKRKYGQVLRKYGQVLRNMVKFLFQNMVVFLYQKYAHVKRKYCQVTEVSELLKLFDIKTVSNYFCIFLGLTVYIGLHLNVNII